MAVDIVSKAALQQHSSKTASARRRDGRTAMLGPVQRQPGLAFAGLLRPANLHPALRYRKRAVFGGIRCQLVKGQRDAERGLRP